jgi:2'-5' RNA ligase
VLRARGELARSFAEMRSEVRRALAGLPVSYPNVPHITLASLPSGTDSSVLRAAVSRWAKGTPPVLVQPLSVGVFPPPHRVLRLEVERTALQDAQSALIHEITERELTELTAAEGLLPAWVFHITIAYCDGVSDDDWVQRVLPLARSLDAPNSGGDCEEAELIRFEQETERLAGRFPLGG